MHQNPFSAENPFSAGTSPRTPLGELTTLPDPIVGWGRGISPPPRRLRRLELGAHGASVLRPASTQNAGYTQVIVATTQ